MPYRVSPIAVMPVSTAAVHFSPQAQQFRPGVIAGRGMVTIPAGWRVVGSPRCQEYNPARWVQIDEFRARTTFETEGQVLAATGKQGRRSAPLDHPVTCFSWRRSVDYIKRLNSSLALADHFMLPTEAEAETAIRGLARDIRAFMVEQGLTAEQFIEYSLLAQEDPGQAVAFENFVTALNPNTPIHNFAPVDHAAFKALLDGATALFAWQVYGTVNGLVTPETAWYNREGTTAVAEDCYISPYGVPGPGHLWRWTGDCYSYNHTILGTDNPANPPRSDHDSSRREIRGGSWGNDPRSLPAALREEGLPGSGGIGLWLVAARVP